jgi:hypothetical protein
LRKGGQGRKCGIVLAPDHHAPPAWLRRLEQLFEVALVLARVPRISRVELLEGDDQGRPCPSIAGGMSRPRRGG